MSSFLILPLVWQITKHFGERAPFTTKLRSLQSAANKVMLETYEAIKKT
jgi:hypothetical protein